MEFVKKINYLLLGAFAILGFYDLNGVFAFEDTLDRSSVTQVDDNKLIKLGDLHEKAEDFIAVNDFKSALDIYSEILLTEPDDEVAYSNMGQIYLIMGFTEKAENAFQNALHINPQNESALIGMQKIVDPDSGQP